MRAPVIGFGAVVLLLAAGFFLGRFYTTDAQTTSTPIEGESVQPDGTPIINVEDLPLDQQPFSFTAPVKVSSLKSYLVTVKETDKLDLILNKVTYLATHKCD